MDIWTGENMSSISHASLSVRSFSKRRREGVKSVDFRIDIFRQLRVLLYQSTCKAGATSKY